MPAPPYPTLLARLTHALTHAARKKRYKALKARLGEIATPAEVFQEIYADNLWNDAESRSGPGSTMAYTASVRAALARLFVERNITRFLDAPCGDFHWMRTVPTPPGMAYIGGDIVPALIADLRKSYGSETRSFQVLDITAGPLPAADLWMCRDCLFHLSYADIARALARFAESDIPLLLTTTYPLLPDDPFDNLDVRTGDARRIDLRADPFNFPEPLERLVDSVAPFAPREMGLWTREQVLPVAAAMAARFLAAESR